MPAGPLSHLRVLDLTMRLAGPYGTQILGDLGAEVIKLEPPGADPTRAFPPNFVAGESTYFLSVNRNKSSIVVDLKQPEGVALALALARNCDVFIENNRPGAVGRLGLDYQAVAAVNPAIIYCSISGFGQDGPDRERPAIDPIIQAVSGGMSLTGEKGGNSVRAGIPIGDICAGMYGVIGILAALARRERTGEGEYVDISMLDVQVAMLSYQAAAYLNGGAVPGLQGRAHDIHPLSNCFTAKDGVDVMVAAGADDAYLLLCETLEAPELAADPRFRDATERRKHRDVLIPAVAEAFRKKGSAEIIAALRKGGYPAGPVNSIDRALDEPQVRHRDMVIALDDTSSGERARVAGDPLRFANAPSVPKRFPPHAGADTLDVLRRVAGYDDSTIAALIDKGVLAKIDLPEGARTF